MKSKKKYKWFWPALGIIAVISPLLIQVFMVSLFSNIPGGSNDGWLGFWGGYLGAIISIAGVYRSIKVQHEDNQKDRVYNNRPFLRCITQYGVKVNDWVYHSDNSIDFDRYSGAFFRLENVSARPAVDILFAVFEEGTGKVVDIIVIPSLVQKAVLVGYRYPKFKDFQKEKIEIVYKSVNDEFGQFVQRFTNDKTIRLPKTSWNEDAKTEYNKLLKLFNEHNTKYQQDLNKVWNQNLSIFNEKDVRYYDRVRHEMLEKKYPGFFKNNNNSNDPNK